MKQGFLIDMDGVIYNGEELITCADKFISTLLKEKYSVRLYDADSRAAWGRRR
jgi:ribonucleotide monophosphatase NagD (HAD superfamily)